MLIKTSYTLNEIADYLGLSVVGDGTHLIQGLNTLQSAVGNEISFLANPKYQKYLSSTQAGAVILSPESQNLFPGNKLVVDTPYYTYALLTELFAPKEHEISEVHPTVIIGKGTQINKHVSIGPNVVIGKNVTIDENVCIGAGCVIGDDVVIGEGSIFYPNVSIYNNVQIGHSAIIHSQVVIGSDGFGFAPVANGSGWQKVHQFGGVVIGHNVEIGAATTIDRGALGDTIIGDGVKLDNHIQVAHNVEIGESTAIAGATAIAGSTTIGRNCTIAGAVGIIGHLVICDNVHITAMTLVTKSITRSGSYSSGTPMNTTSEWKKNAARFNRLDKMK